MPNTLGKAPRTPKMAIKEPTNRAVASGAPKMNVGPTRTALGGSVKTPTGGVGKAPMTSKPAFTTKVPLQVKPIAPSRVVAAPAHGAKINGL